ncbi:hypothetical protein [Helicobacter pametensis]|uniref:hypothetical protein n=1 Tax=Helicobacter pametensis TaxID=95149 RepID=UPI0004805057|nr:hypothetical protein [Helicobacter pametensis]
MKKQALLLLASASLMLATSQTYKQKVADLLSKKTQRDIQVKEVLDLDGSKNLKVVILNDKKDKTEIAALATEDGNIIIGLSNIFLSKSDKDLAILAQAYQSTQPKPTPPNPEALNKFFPSIAQDRLISLKSTAKKPKQTFYLVSDPRCPGCRKELDTIQDKLKEGDVKILLVSFLGEESAYKAKLIYDKVAKLKDDRQKLKILQEVFNPDYKLTPKDKTQNIKMIQQNSEDVSKVGIQSVPFVHSIQK